MANAGKHVSASRRPLRTTLYAAFTGAGSPIFGHYGTLEKRLAAELDHARAQGKVPADAHVKRVTISLYNRLLAARGWPVVNRVYL